jgi:hypothetical protein
VRSAVGIDAALRRGGDSRNLDGEQQKEKERAGKSPQPRTRTPTEVVEIERVRRLGGVRGEEGGIVAEAEEVVEMEESRVSLQNPSIWKLVWTVRHEFLKRRWRCAAIGSSGSCPASQWTALGGWPVKEPLEPLGPVAHGQ